MVINKDKVIVLPREFVKNPEAFVCPCEICAQRAYEDQIRKSNVEEIKQSVEEMLNSTSLYTRTFNIDIVTHDQTQLPLNLASDDQEASLEDLAPFEPLRKHIQRVTAAFNRRYRHPLVCKIYDIADQLQMQSSVYRTLYQNEEQEEMLLWQYQKIVSLLSELQTTAKIIQREEFLKPLVIDTVINKTIKAKQTAIKILKARFIEALSLQHFRPTSSTDEFYIEYNY